LLLSGMLLFCGGAFLTMIGVAIGEPAHWHWSVSGIGALVYLTVFGSCVAYSAYVWLIHHVNARQAEHHRLRKPGGRAGAWLDGAG